MLAILKNRIEKRRMKMELTKQEEELVLAERARVANQERIKREYSEKEQADLAEGFTEEFILELRAIRARTAAARAGEPKSLPDDSGVPKVKGGCQIHNVPATWNSSLGAINSKGEIESNAVYLNPAQEVADQRRVRLEEKERDQQQMDEFSEGMYGGGLTFVDSPGKFRK